MKFLEKIRSLPERTRKIILWVIVIVLAIIMLSFWIGRIPGRIKQIDLPKIEIPKFNVQTTTSTQEN